MKVYHTLKPIYNKNSKILILGSIPSVESRHQLFYYAHPTNRFWIIMEKLFNVKLTTNEIKEKFLLKNRIALWDVIKSCDITSSNDASIKNVKVNNVNKLIKASKINCIFCTGKKAYDLYNKYLKDKINVECIYLPSTSSANASYNLDKLIKCYEIIKYKI